MLRLRLSGGMNSIDFALKTAENHVLFAIPNQVLWSGRASIACAAAIEGLAQELRQLQSRLSVWFW
jgi:hypothetical protein